MGRVRFAGVVVTGVGLAAALGCSGVRSLDTGGVPVLTLADLAADVSEETAGRLTSGEPVLLHLTAGDVVPLRMSLEVPFAALEAGENRVRIKSDLYLYLSRGGVWVGPDGARWAAIDDPAGIKELFGFQGGTVQIGFGAERETGAFLQFAVATQ